MQIFHTPWFFLFSKLPHHVTTNQFGIHSDNFNDFNAPGRFCKETRNLIILAKNDTDSDTQTSTTL